MPTLAQRYRVRALGVFGSYVRNEQTPTSDLDVLVEFDTLPGLFTYVELQEELAALLGVPVDLVHRADVKPHIADSLLAEVVMI
ncbi:MAG: nucleotidyltransferase family protein [Chloroflexaceae bacterium]|nr:nucleotidyltransferase family protein [Chloroflexaceae bacterium]